jgi:hypothetical protein
MKIPFEYLTCKFDSVGIREMDTKHDEIVRRFLQENEDFIIPRTIDELKADAKEKAQEYFDGWRKSQDAFDILKLGAKGITSIYDRERITSSVELTLEIDHSHAVIESRRGFNSSSPRGTFGHPPSRFLDFESSVDQRLHSSNIEPEIIRLLHQGQIGRASCRERV